MTYRILFIIIEPIDGNSGLVRVLRVLHGAQQSLLVAEPSDENIPNEG